MWLYIVREMCVRPLVFFLLRVVGMKVGPRLFMEHKTLPYDMLFPSIHNEPRKGEKHACTMVHVRSHVRL